jgi:hypothetical protein
MAAEEFLIPFLDQPTQRPAFVLTRGDDALIASMVGKLPAFGIVAFAAERLAKLREATTAPTDSFQKRLKFERTHWLDPE